MQLGISALRSFCQDLRISEHEPDVVDLLLLSQQTDDNLNDLQITFRKGADLERQLEFLRNCLNTVKTHGVDPQLTSLIRTTIGLESLAVSQEGLWDAIVSIYEAVKKFIIDLLKRLYNWIRGVKSQVASAHPIIHGRLKAIYNNAPVTFPVKLADAMVDREKFDNTTIDGFSADKFLGFNPTDPSPTYLNSTSPVAIVVSMACELPKARNIDNLYTIITDPSNPFIGGFVSKAGPELILSTLQHSMEQARASGPLKALGWTPELAVTLAMFMSMKIKPQAPFSVFFQHSPDTTPLVDFDQTIQTIHTRIIEPELQSIHTQCDAIIASVRGQSDSQQIASKLEEDIMRRRRQAATVSGFLTTLSSMHSRILAYVVQMLNAITPPGGTK